MKSNQRVANWLIFLITVIAGMMLAIQFQSHAEPGTGESRDMILTLRNQIQDERRKHQELRNEIFKYQMLKNQYERASNDEEEISDVMYREMEEARRQAGLTTMEGPGLILLIDVPQYRREINASQARQEVYQKLLDNDVRALVDELYGNGAKAISINNYRLLVYSTIRKVGNSIQVNTHPVALPFEIRIIGDADTLLAALQVSDIPNVFREIGLEITPEKKERVIVPPYQEKQNIQYMKRLKESE